MGGLAQSKISLPEESEILLDFFCKKVVGWSYLIQKGSIIRKRMFFSPKGGGGLAHSKTSLSENWGIQVSERGGVSEFCLVFQ